MVRAISSRLEANNHEAIWGCSFCYYNNVPIMIYACSQIHVCLYFKYAERPYYVS